MGASGTAEAHSSRVGVGRPGLALGLAILTALIAAATARAAPPDAPTGTTTTQRLLADNDFALLAGTPTNVTRHLYNNPTVWWGQDEMWATNPQFPVVYGETHIYIIAMGDNEVDDFGGRINGVDITDIAAGERAVVSTEACARVGEAEWSGGVPRHCFLVLNDFLHDANVSDTMDVPTARFRFYRDPVAYGGFTPRLVNVQTALTGARWETLPRRIGDATIPYPHMTSWISCTGLELGGKGSTPPAVPGRCFDIPSGTAVAFRFTVGDVRMPVVPGDRAATLRWNAPASDGGSTVTGYEFQHTLDDTTWSEPSSTAACPTAQERCRVMAGLTPGLPYRFRVRAVNADGPGDWSAPTAWATPLGPTAAPLDLAAERLDESAQLTWTAPPAAGDAAITSYVVEVDDGTGWATATTAACATSAATCRVVQGLANGTAYRFRVRAVNAYGPSADSTTATATPVAQPGPPQAPALAYPRDRGYLVASWEPPTGRADAVLEYETEVEGLGVICSRTRTSRDCSRSVPAYGASYRSRTRARGPLGWSAWSAWSEPVVPLDVPLQPGRAKAAEVGDGQITFFWHDWIERGRPVNRYDVTVQPGGRSCTWELGDGPLTCTVTGLTNGVEYVGRVTGTNEIGTGRAVDAGYGTPFGRPVPPTDLSLRVGSATGRLTVSSTGVSTSNGRRVERREFEVEPGGFTCAGDGYQCDVIGVPFGGTYRVRARARTEGGWSDWSDWSAPLLAERIPGKPRFIDFLPGDARLHLAWEEPTYAGRPVLEYEACVYPVQASRGPYDFWSVQCVGGYGARICKVQASARALGCTFTGLWNGLIYRAAVRARNGLGWGDINWSGAGSGASEFVAPVATPRSQWHMTTTGRAKVRTTCISKEPCEVRARLTFPVSPFIVLGEWVEIDAGATVDLQVELPAEFRRRLAEGDDFVVQVRMETRSGRTDSPKVLPLSAPPADSVGPITRVNRTPTREFTAVADCDGEGISRCSGTVTLEPVAGARAGRAARDPDGLGSMRFSVAAGERIVIRLGLDAEGRRLLQRRGAVPVRPVIRAEGGMPVPTLPVVRFMAVSGAAFGARVAQVAATQEREAMLRIVRAASDQRLHWREAVRRLRVEVMPVQGAALRAALDLPQGAPEQRRVRRLVIASAERQLAATRGYIRWFAHDDRDAQRRAVANDRAARALLGRALRQARAADR